jgi:hypothetical protein
MSGLFFTRSIPLGVPGEWTWSRIPGGITPGPWLLGVIAILMISGCVAAGSFWLRGGGLWREALLVLALAVLAVFGQSVVQMSAPAGYDLGKWSSLAISGSSGYWETTKRAARGDLGGFWRRFPAWIAHQDELHIGTHPPGLFLWYGFLDQAVGRWPEMAAWVRRWTPEQATRGFTQFTPGLTSPDRASIAMTAGLTLMLCALTVLPLYLLARRTLGPQGAWLSASLWIFAPAANLFQPTADTALPFLSTVVFALACHAHRGGHMLPAITSGVLLAIGMQISLVFLAVGFTVAMIFFVPGGRGFKRVVGLLLATGIGFLAVTVAIWFFSGANPFVIWWSNQQNHARFYTSYPRSRWPWMGINAIETAIAIGVPASLGLVWAVVTRARQVPALTWATIATLVVLTVTGRSLSEVARLWLPFHPALLMGAAIGFQCRDEVMNTGLERLFPGRGGASARLGNPWLAGGLVALTGVFCLVLEHAIQVIYPI